MLAWIQKLIPKTGLETRLLRRLKAGSGTKRALALGSIVFALLWLAPTQPASATVTIIDDLTVSVDAVDDTFGINYACSAAGDPLPGATKCQGGDNGPGIDLSAMSFWTVTSFDTGAGTVEFDISIMNSTSAGDANRITQFVVVVLTPVPTTATETLAMPGEQDQDWEASVDTTLPGFNKIDLFLFDDANPVVGVGEGEIDFLHVVLGGLDFGLYTELTLMVFPIKFQSVNSGVNGENDSFEFDGVLKRVRVPEPATLLIYGIGLLGLGVFARRRRRFAA